MTMSVEQKKFLKKIKIRKVTIFAIQFIIICSLFIMWEYLSSRRIINPFIYSSPKKIIKVIIELGKSGNLFNHIFCTLQEIMISFLGGSILGLLLAILFYEFKILFKVIEPFLITLNSLPKVALGPLIIIISGANFRSIIIMTLLINLIVTILNIYSGFINTDYSKLMLIKSFKATKLQTLKYLVIPSSLNNIISALKINISMTLIGVIMGEFLVSKQGIGYLIIYGTQIFDMNLVMAGVLILVFISLLIYIVVTYLEKQLKN